MKKELPARSPRNNDPESFWNRVDVKGPDDCWIWKGKPNTTKWQYGRMRWKGKRELSNRIAFEIRNGAFPKNLALHTCDNPRCCNPNHIYDGTYQQNNKDAVARRRNKYPSVSQWTKLTEKEVREIRATLPSRTRQTSAALAAKYNVSQGTITHIFSGRSRASIK
jgi:hypothetical protein